jgi:hypothetical protein
MYGRELMLRALLAPDAFTPLTMLQIALTRTIPPANASADQLVEATTGGYARQDYPALATHWAPSGFGELYNVQTIWFPPVTATWGLISGWAVLDPVSGQTISVGSVLDPYVTVIGMIPRIEPGVLSLGIYD